MGLKENIGLVLAIAGAGGGMSVLTLDEGSDLDRKTCQAMAAGQDLTKDFDRSFFGLRAPQLDFGSTTSLDASLATCREDRGVDVTRECAAASILKSIGSGEEVPRALIEDARLVTEECK